MTGVQTCALPILKPFIVKQIVQSNSHYKMDLITKIKRQLGPDFHKISTIIIFGLLIHDLKITILILISFLSAWWFYRTALVLVKASKVD